MARNSERPARDGRRHSRSRIIAALLIATFAGPAAARQIPTIGPAGPTEPPPTVDMEGAAPGIATAAPPALAALPPDLQVVRFQGPEGLRVEVLDPPGEPVPIGDGAGLTTVGLRVGPVYRLRLTNLPNAPGAELYPTLEVVGHLHRPAEVDPGKYPIRVVFSQLDLDDVVDRGRMIVKVVYLEDPELALPAALDKDEVASTDLIAGEDPLKVAAALGRAMAVVRLGARIPSAEDAPLNAAPVGRAPCPFTAQSCGPCALPCGPAHGTPPPAGRPWLPKDEYLCDGGDFGNPVRFEGDGALRGIDPRDALIRFNADGRDRVLPTNVVCIYSPRFGDVRLALGPNSAETIDGPLEADVVEAQLIEAARQGPKRYTLNQSPELARHRARPSAFQQKLGLGEHFELRVLGSMDAVLGLDERATAQVTQVARNRQKLILAPDVNGPVTIRVGEGAVITGVAEGPGEAVMAWPAREIAGVELPPDKPGLAVLKQASVSEALPGDEVTFTIRYKNIGNVPIRSASVVDSLLPRFEYVTTSARGPAGAVFTAGENRVGSTELRWDLPGAIAPGAEGSVSFRALVR